jgi:hypothetical protein
MNDPLSMNIVCQVSDIFPRTNEGGEPAYIASTNLYYAIVVQVHPHNLPTLRDEVQKRGGRILQESTLTV